MPVQINMRELLDAGVHYGHQCRRWNPKMGRYIFGSRNGVHIIDLQKTVRHFKKACDFIEKVTSEGGHVLFVGTKRQARTIVQDEALRSKMFFINHRWLGGTLTNFPTIRNSIHRLKRIEKMSEDGTYEKLTKKEVLNLDRLKFKLERNLGGVKDMPGLPSAVFIADAHKESIAISEAKKLGIPLVAIADTNSDPQGIDFPIPGNDDSVKSLSLFIRTIADACILGAAKSKDFLDKDDKTNRTQDGTIYDQEGHAVKVVAKPKKDKKSESTSDNK